MVSYSPWCSAHIPCDFGNECSLTNCDRPTNFARNNSLSNCKPATSALVTPTRPSSNGPLISTAIAWLATLDTLRFWLI